MAKLAIFVCFGMMLNFCVEADLDVHCLHKHVRGTWTFHMTEANMDKNGIKCSKGVTEAYGSKSNNYGLGKPNYKPVKTIEVELGKKNVASATIGGKHHKGTWTMIYDEGFEVNINDQTFFAFSKYKTKGSKSLSYCGKTFPGWYHPVKDVDAKKWGCYHGIKKTKVQPQEFRKFGRHWSRGKKDVYVPEDDLVAHVNNSPNFAWKARRYTEFEGQPMHELEKRMGTVLHPYKLLPSDRAEQQRWAAEEEMVDISDLPAEWDWTKHGVVDSVINQGACGSCYAVATAEMMQSRMRILGAKKKDVNTISPDRVIKCARYAQGCNGGFPFLAAKYHQDYGSVTEKTEPYSASNGHCPKVTPKQYVGRAVGHKYVGGYYGASSEEAMLRELFDHGPLVVGFEVGVGFNTYSSGVFHTAENLPEKNHWERVNHAVLLVGYGKDNGVPFWKVKNSWGQFWGEDGYFRIKRGDDNLNIEHMAVASYPTVGHSLPAGKNDLIMTGKVSQGHKFLAMNNVQTKEVKQPKMDTVAKADKAADAIFDPAFTRAQRATPALEEVQTFTEDQVGEREEADGVVEESNGVVWPEA